MLSQEVLALLMLGEEGAASYTLDVLEKLDDPRPEIIVCVAYLRAFLHGDGDERNALNAFDTALEKLSLQDSRKAHTRAQVALFKGKILQRVGDLRGAESQYLLACSATITFPLERQLEFPVSGAGGESPSDN